MKRPAAILPILAVLLLAAAVRLPTLTAGYPYMNYVDEGNFLHPVATMLREGRWEPGWYMYPSLPLITVATVARLPVHDLAPQGEMYDLLAPELLLAGRVMSLLAGLGLVLLAGRLGARLGGPRAGFAAALLAALAPPLVIRGAIASVDPYAAFFVLAALLFADRLRTAERPGWEALAAGAMAGLAFAAKYPALLVGLAPLWIVLRSARPWRDKLRLLLTGVLGATLAAVIAMPGLLLHPREVWEAVRRQGELYAGLPSEASLWRQAFVRAEWDLPYEHPELGAVFVLLALAGLIAALRDRDLAPTAQGLTLYAAATLLLFSRYSFHPFRNLLPLVAPACILIALLWVRLRARLSRPIWADAAAGALLVLLFAVPVTGYAAERLRLRDSRAEAIDWLAPRLRPGDSVVFVRNLAILPGELARLRGDVIQRHWSRVARVLRSRRTRFLVASLPAGAVAPAEIERILSLYEIRARFGEHPTPADPSWWHGNRQKVLILERKNRG
jgi:4-amino-4-deoxy-L-arabinose transferase-like glycosyltransferase